MLTPGRHVAIGLIGWMGLSLLAGCGQPSATEHHGNPHAHKQVAAQAAAPVYSTPTSGTASFTQASPSPTFSAVAFSSSHDGLMGGPGLIWATPNGGTSWTPVYTGSARIRAFSYAPGGGVFARSDHRILSASSPSGPWHAVYRSSSGIGSMSWTSREDGFAVFTVGSTTALRETTDGGWHWAPVSTPSAPDAVRFDGSRVGWMVTRKGSIYRTVNQGATWTLSFSLPSSPVAYTGGYGSRIHLAGPDNVWVEFIGGSGMSQTSYSVYHTSDGTHWRAVSAVSTAGAGPAPGNPVYAVRGPGSSPGPLAVPNSTTAFLLGECEACGAGMSSITATANGGQTWSPVVPIFGANGLPGMHALSFPSPSTGYLVVPGYNQPSQLLVTHNQGQTWTALYPHHLSPLSGISFVTPSVGYGIGLPGLSNAVLKTTDGGRHWQEISTLPQSEASSGWLSSTSPIAFTSETRGFAVAANGTLYVTHDGGHSWVKAASASAKGPQPPVLDLFGSHGCAGAVAQGTSGRVLWTTDGGMTWHLARQESGSSCLQKMVPTWLALRSTADVAALGRLGRNLAWAVTYARTWYVTGDHGKHVATIRVPSTFVDGIQSISYVNGHDAWLVTPLGQLYHSTNGGLAWTLLP